MHASQGAALLEGVAETFDDDFLFPQEPVHQEAAALVVGFDDDDDSLGGIGVFGLEPEPPNLTSFPVVRSRVPGGRNPAPISPAPPIWRGLAGLLR